ncbi:MAG: MCP four helix bundle domain-containing protein [Burkholderiaceae bacterium]|nr:MCP four helix bundle domain-containing protein [Burkholderiaceae bacterium]
MNLSHLLRQFSIRTRMIGAIGMVLVLLAVVGSVGIYGMHLLKQQNREFAQSSLADSHDLTQLVTTLGDLRRYEKDMIISYEKPEAVKAHRAKWDATLVQFRTVAKHMLEGPEDLDNPIVQKMGPQLDDYVKQAEPILKQLEAGAYDNAAVADKLLGRAKDAFTSIEKSLAELSVAMEKESVQTQAGIDSTQSNMQLAFMIILAFSALVVVPLTLLNMNSICGPLVDAEGLASAIANGNLHSKVSAIEGQDEASHLMRSLQAMQQSLQRLVGEVRSSADHIRTASVEIASGNQDLSSRTEQTASNLQQTASSMQQLTATVRQSADAARTANQLASSAAEVASRGGNVVSQVVTTMDEINTSSKKISDIIGVIDGIAFQTNILALNAAVEAARAGEQGRGFAVVAGEVRSLAQRSAEAAKEIKTLIGASVERVETGARLVQDAGTTMNEIVASVQRVTDIMGEITAAASEQSEGIGSVNQSVSQLDQMTQQNAALVEESAAAAESLKEQAQRLGQVVDQFQLAEHHAAAPPPPTTYKPAPTPAAKPAQLASKVLSKAKASAKTSGSASVSKPASKPASTPAPKVATPKATAPTSASSSDGDWETF